MKTLVVEYSDVFTVDMSAINTGDNPLWQPVRCTPFALHDKMEELIQNMMAQGVIQHSSSVLVIRYHPGIRKILVLMPCPI